MKTPLLLSFPGACTPENNLLKYCQPKSPPPKKNPNLQEKTSPLCPLNSYLDIHCILDLKNKYYYKKISTTLKKTSTPST